MVHTPALPCAAPFPRLPAVLSARLGMIRLTPSVILAGIGFASFMMGLFLIYIAPIVWASMVETRRRR